MKLQPFNSWREGEKFVVYFVLSFFLAPVAAAPVIIPYAWLCGLFDKLKAEQTTPIALPPDWVLGCVGHILVLGFLGVALLYGLRKHEDCAR